MSPLSPQLKETLVEHHQRLLVETDSYVELIRIQKKQIAKLEAKVWLGHFWDSFSCYVQEHGQMSLSRVITV